MNKQNHLYKNAVSDKPSVNKKLHFITKFWCLALGMLSLLVLLQCEKKHDSLTKPELKEIIFSPANLIAKVGDRQISLSWEMASTKNIHFYYIFKKDSAQHEMTLLDSTFKRTYTDINIKNGWTYYYQVSAVDSQGYEGKRSAEIIARADIYSVSINSGAGFANDPIVALTFTAPLTTRYLLVGNDSTFTGKNWESYVSNKAWELTPGDGQKFVYARFRNLENNENFSIARGTIVLDTKATISQVRENTNGIVKMPGETIHFKIVTGESQGKATLDIGSVKQGIQLYDDGTNGDQNAANGIYEVDYIIPINLKIQNAVVTGHFTDRANNVAEDVTAPTQITIQDSPTSINLFPPVQSGANQKELELIWTEASDETFNCYRIFRSNQAGVDTTSLLIATINSRSTTNYTDTNLKENTDYFYRVFVYNYLNQVKGSNEVKGRLAQNNFPAPVLLYPVLAGDNSRTSLKLSWTRNSDTNFSSYNIFRETAAGIDSTSKLVTTIFTQSTTEFEDQNLKEGTTYHYRVYVYNTDGLSSGSNEVHGATINNTPPTPVSAFKPSPVAQSLTALTLRWSRNADEDFAAYKIFQSRTAGVDSTDLLVTTITEQGTTQYEDNQLAENSTYFYKIYVYDTQGLSRGSNEVNGKTNANAAPLAVILYKPSPVGNSINSLQLSWSQNTDDDFASYKIYRKTSAGVDSESQLVTTITVQNTTTFEDTNLEENTEYYYRIFVYDTRGLATGSNEDKGKTNSNKPPVAVLLAQPTVVTQESLRLNWSRNNDTDFKMYLIYRSLAAPVDITKAPIAIINDQSITTYTDEELTANTPYFYRIFVEDKGGLSSGSNEVSGTPKP